MNEKQLTNAIREGITQSRNEFLSETIRSIWWSIGIVLIGLILFFAWNQYIEWRYPSPPMQVSEQSCFPLENLHCQIYQKGRYFKCNDGLIHETVFFVETQEYSNISSISTNVNNSILPCAEVSNQIPIIRESICGYQEANAWFEQIKINNQESQFELIMECN